MNDTARPAVRRVLARDDLLTLAAAADRAVGIVRSKEDVARRGRDGRTLFDIALDRQLKLAREDERWAIRAQAWDHAAVLVRFCALVNVPFNPPLDPSCTAEELHERALRELADHSDDMQLDLDLTLGVFNRYHAARNLRLAGRYKEALKLVKRPETELYGTGAEPHMAHYLYEVGAAFIEDGRAEEINRPLREWETYWETTRAAGYSTRYRFDFVRALALWQTAPADEAVYQQLRTTVEHLATGAAEADDEGVRELSVLLATAEYLAGGEHTDEAVAEAVRLGTKALLVTDRIRARWRVIARSRAPLAVVFERIYGDLALLAERLPGPAAARLGFRVALSAKRTGFAARIRDGQTFDDNPRVNNLLNQIVEIEGSSANTFTDNPRIRDGILRALRQELADAVSPMLADTVFPPPTELHEIIEAIGPRYVLDYVELRDTLDNSPRLFRTLIEPGGRMWFDRCELDRDRIKAELASGLAAATARDLPSEEPVAEPDLDYRALALAVLPERLITGVLADGRPPVGLLVSAHSWLSLVPWAALRITETGVRLVERAVISQSPVLTCLSGDLPPRVSGRALIRLVGRDEHGVDVALERQAWDLGPGTRGVPPHGCDLLPGARPQPHGERFDAALTEPDAWQFLHIAAHGAGKGFDQFLDIPNERLSAARAIGLKWPTSVLMASCHVGMVDNDNGAEPLSFVMALLTGGARCVVAGIHRIDDEGTGRAASRIVAAIRDGGVPLDVALRDAQLAAVADGTKESGWALLSAYVR